MTMPPLWTCGSPLLLASTSRTRRALLESAGLPDETEAPGVDERAIEAESREEGLDPAALAQRLAVEKALAVSRRHPERIVLGGDQVLALDGETFHKPEDRNAARIQILRLAGRTHHLRSAGAVARGGRVVDVFADSASLTMRALAPDAVDLYLDLAGPAALSSVGCYQVEGLGIHLFDSVMGDHATILGLPLRPLLAILRRLGCLAL
jgi:septum formation protein